MRCFSFKDTRVVSSKGNLRGTVVHNGSGDVYGGVYGCDSNNKIRLKCAGVFFSAPFVAVGRVALRALMWTPRACWEGYKRGLKSWENRRVEILRSDAIDKKLPGKADLALRVAACTLYVLGRDLLKIVAIPFAALYTMFWSIGSIVAPLTARREIAKAAEATYVDLGNMVAWYYPFHAAGLIAPCMQPKRVWDERNLYRLFPDFSPKTIRSQLLLLKKQLDSMSVYFSPEDHKHFIDIVQALRATVKTIVGYSDGDEYDLIQENEKELFEATHETYARRKVLEKGACLAELNTLVSSYRKELVSSEEMPARDRSLDEIKTRFEGISNWLSKNPKSS